MYKVIILKDRKYHFLPTLLISHMFQVFAHKLSIIHPIICGAFVKSHAGGFSFLKYLFPCGFFFLFYNFRYKCVLKEFCMLVCMHVIKETLFEDTSLILVF